MFHFVFKTKRYCLLLHNKEKSEARGQQQRTTETFHVLWKKKEIKKRIKPRHGGCIATEYFSMLVHRESNMEIVWFTTYSNTCAQACARETTRSQFCSALDRPLLAKSIDMWIYTQSNIKSIYLDKTFTNLKWKELLIPPKRKVILLEKLLTTILKVDRNKEKRSSIFHLSSDIWYFSSLFFLRFSNIEYREFQYR